jgi:phosphatidylglycerophosphate synthase
MIERIAELKVITSKPGGERGNWMVRHITRNIAIYFTWLILHTPISANGVSVISLALSLVGGLFFICGTPLFYLLGVLAFHLWYIFDHVDGQVARYKKQTNVTGIFFDYFTHYIVNICIFLSLGIGLYRASLNFNYLILGIIASYSFVLLNLIFDSRNKAFVTQLIRQDSKFIVNTKRIYNESPKSDISLKLTAKTFFTILHKSCEVHIIINVLTFAALINVTLYRVRGYDFLILPLAYYAFVLTLVWVLKFAYSILNKTIDRDFHSYFDKE